MTTEKITLDSEIQAIKFYGHLSKDVSMGKLIKNMNFAIDHDRLPLIFKEILRIAFALQE